MEHGARRTAKALHDALPSREGGARPAVLAVSVNAIFQREGADTKPLGSLMLAQYALAMPSIVAAVVAASRMSA